MRLTWNYDGSTQSYSQNKPYQISIQHYFGSHHKKTFLVPEALYAHKTFSTKEIIRSDADSNNYISTVNKTKVKAVIKPLAPLMKVGEYQHSQYL